MRTCVSNPAVKNIGEDTIGVASGTLGILKVLLTEQALEALSFTPYPGLEETAAKVDTTAIDALAANLDTARQAGDDAELLHAIGGMATLGVDFQTGITGVYNCSTATASTTASTAARGCSRAPTTTTFAGQSGWSRRWMLPPRCHPKQPSQSRGSSV